MIDISKARAERVAARAAAAEREVNPDGEPIILDGTVLAVLPSEIPFAAVAPLRKVTREVTMLLGEAIRITQGGKADEDTTGLVLALLTAQPDLPEHVITVIQEITTALVGADGLQAILDAHLSLSDIQALARGVFDHYGVALGESQRSSDSSTSGGPTSSATSSAGTDSTPAASSEPLALPAHSESLAS